MPVLPKVRVGRGDARCEVCSGTAAVAAAETDVVGVAHEVAASVDLNETAPTTEGDEGLPFESPRTSCNSGWRQIQTQTRSRPQRIACFQAKGVASDPDPTQTDLADGWLQDPALHKARYTVPMVEELPWNPPLGPWLFLDLDGLVPPSDDPRTGPHNGRVVGHDPHTSSTADALHCRSCRPGRRSIAPGGYTRPDEREGRGAGADCLDGEQER